MKEMQLSKMIGNRLKELRLNHKYTQQEVADNIGISRSTYAGYEGKNIPDVTSLIKLAGLYSVSTDSILFNLSINFDMPIEFKEILSELTNENREKFWIHLLEYAKYLSKK
ncbi:hypothetical protein CN514_00805 [Bacillus sp. AFS001701]|uniref:helix-turn-helix domain-containing protein n=1 Tax=Bacillus sp. AFS001701 TaxID=2033480 RepID=UPI000BF704C8|nr:helix-turn-helix transcriptional regulator [Bacillus sp. AFS001701]PET77569.1 hypothetical protein CN514_00805 [Bacillus sp. AFS001701]